MRAFCPAGSLILRALRSLGLASLAIPCMALAQEVSSAEPADTGAAGPLTADLQIADASLVRQAAAFLSAGKLREAREMLAPLRQQPVPDMEVLFLSGMIYETAGDYARAAAEFRLMLVRDPQLPRPRLELARSLFLMKDYEGARYNFQQLMAGDIPPAVRHNIDRYMLRIREQVPSFSVNVEMVRDSNPVQLTSSNLVTLGGLNYKLSNVAPGNAVTGLLASASGRLPLPSDPSFYASFAAQLWEFPGKTMDQAYGLATLGKNAKWGAHTLSAELGAHQFEYQWKPLYRGPVFRVLDYFQQQPTLAWRIDLERRLTSYPDYAYLDGWQQIASLNGIYTPSIVSRLDGGINVVSSKAESSAYSFTNPNVFVRASHEWRGGLITGASIQYGFSDYQDADPFFGVRRRDQDARGELSVMDRQMQFGRFTPRLIVGYISHRSNISLYTYRRAYVNLGISRDF